MSLMIILGIYQLIFGTANPYSYATLYYADNGSHIFGSEYFYFNVPECYNVWIEHTDSDGDYMNSDD